MRGSDSTSTRAPASASATDPIIGSASGSSVGQLSTLKSSTKSCKKLSRRYGITWQALRSSPQPKPPRSRAGSVRRRLKRSKSSCYANCYPRHHTHTHRAHMCIAQTRIL